MLSKNDCSVKEMKDFVATYRTRLAVLYKRVGGLSGDKHLKSGLVEERSLSDKQVKSLIGASILLVCYFLCLFCLAFLFH